MSTSGPFPMVRARRPWAGVATVVTAVAVGLAPADAGQPASCRVLQPAELESVLGGKATPFSNAGAGQADFCSGQVGARKVLIRVAERTRPDGTLERRGIEMARKQGIQVDVKTEGDLTCSTLVPPAALSQMGFNTTCSIVRGSRVVAVEVTAPSRKEMAPMDAVRRLVEKAAARL